MMKKVMTVLVVLAFVGVSMTMMSCAKKQVGVAQPTKVEPKPAPVPAPAPAPAPAPRVEDVDKAQKLRAEIQAFESTHIYFDFDKSEVKPEAKAVLERRQPGCASTPSTRSGSRDTVTSVGPTSTTWLLVIEGPRRRRSSSMPLESPRTGCRPSALEKSVRSALKRTRRAGPRTEGTSSSCPSEECTAGSVCHE